MALFNKLTIDTLSMFGKIGVNLFALISGYHSAAKNFNFRKVAKVEFETLFVSWILLITSFSLSYAGFASNTINKKSIIVSLFPTAFGEYWYSAAYIIVLLIGPFLHRFVEALQSKQKIGFILLLIIIWGIIPTFTLQAPSLYGWNNYSWFIITYLAGIILRDNRANWPKMKTIIIYCIVSIAIHCMNAITVNLFFHDTALQGYSTYLRCSNTITSMLISVSLLMLFVKRKEFTNNSLNVIASSTFCMYLIQEQILFRSIMWKDIFNIPIITNNSLTIMLMCIAMIIITIFIAGVCFHSVIEALERIFLDSFIVTNQDRVASFMENNIYFDLSSKRIDR